MVVVVEVMMVVVVLVVIVFDIALVCTLGVISLYCGFGVRTGVAEPSAAGAQLSDVRPRKLRVESKSYGELSEQLAVITVGNSIGQSDRNIASSS